MSSDLLSRLHALSRHEHDDLTIGTEAADRIAELARIVSGLRHDLAVLRAIAVDLRRENAALQRDLAKLKKLDEFDSPDWVQELIYEVDTLRLRRISSNDELDRLDRETALLREDKARLDHLVKHTSGIELSGDGVILTVCTTAPTESGTYETLCAAIDAARGKAGE